MINFFRKIRQQLLTESKVSKYLLYAIGEIILVVFGILIALQINNWNEDRKHSLAEKEFIAGVKNDLTKDREYISLILKISEVKERIYNTINTDLFNLTVRDKMELDSLFTTYLANNRTFYPVVGTFQSAISGNELGKFKNKKFSSAATNLYNTTYPRLMDNGRNYDERFYYVVKKYSHERRTGRLRKMNETQLNELLDDLYYHSKSRQYYVNLLNIAIIELDDLLKVN